jgi:hypothetical protein
MKTLKSFAAILATVVVCSASAFADNPTGSNLTTTQVLLPVYKIVKDCELTYYRTKVNGEDVLVDSKGRFIKYLCSEEDLKIPESFQVLTVPLQLFNK